MKFSTAAALTTMAASAVSAFPANGTAPAVTTEVVDVWVTYFPMATTIVNGDHTYVVTEPTTLTMSDGPYTVTKPVYTTSSVICQDGCATATPVPAYPGHSNSTANPAPSKPVTNLPTTTGSSEPGVETGVETPIPTGAAAKMAGAGLAAVLGFAVFAL